MADNELNIKATVEDEGVTSALTGMMDSFKGIGDAAEKVGETILKVIEKIQQAQDEVEKMRQDMEDATLSAVRQADAIDLTNLKLEDQIAKLEGAQSSNALKEALLESTTQANELSTALEGVLRKMHDLLEKQSIGFFKSLATGLAQTKELAEKAEPAIQQLEELQRKESLALAEFDLKNHDILVKGTKDQQKDLLDRRIQLQQHWNEQIKTITDGIQREADADQKELDAKKKTRVELLTIDHWEQGGEQAVAVAAISRAEAEERVNREYSAQEETIQSLWKLGAAYYQASTAAVDSANLHLKAANAQEAADAKAAAAARAAALEQAGRAFMKSLEDRLSAEKQTHLISREEELRFWQAKLGLARAYPNAYQQIMHRIGAIDQQIFKQRELNEKEFFRTSEAQAERWAAENMRLAKQANDAVIKENKDKLDAAAAYYDGQIKLAKTDEQIQEQNAARDLALGRITKEQEIATVAAAKQRELQLEIKYLQAKEQIYSGDEKEVAKIEAQISDLIKQQELVRAKAAADSAKVSQQAWQKTMSGMENLFSSFTKDIISGHTTIAQSWANLVDGMANKLLEGLEKQLMASIENSIRQTAIHEETVAAGDAIDQASEAKRGLGAAISAAKGAWSWAANNDMLPFAPVIAAGAFAAVEAFGSAEGGQWVVPGQQWTLVHPQESIIPAYIANPMRNFFENTGSGFATAQVGQLSSGIGGRGPNGVTVVVNHSVNAIDAESFQGAIRKHGNMIGNEIARVLRKKGFSPT